MAGFVGNYKGNWAEWQPTLISGSANKLWLDGSNLFDLRDDLISYWKLDETSGDAIDSHGDYNGTLYNSPTQGSTGKINTSYVFNGTNGINIGDFGSDLLDNFSISVWARRSISVINRRIISRWGQWEIGIDGTGFLIFDTGTEYSSGYDFETLGTTWHHIVVVINGANSKFYVNGTQEGSDFSPTITYSALADTAIGTRNIGASGWRGYIDEVGVWNRVLSGGEVQALYNSGSGLAYPLNAEVVTSGSVSLWADRSGNGNHFEQATTAAMPYYSSSTNVIVFDGVQEYLSGSGVDYLLDTQGDLFIVYNNLQDITQAIYSISDLSDGSYYINYSQLSDGTPRIVFDNPSNNEKLFPSGSLLKTIIEYGSNGSNYIVSSNGMLNPITSGNDTGEWSGDLSQGRTGVQIGGLIRSTAANYYNFEMYEMLYFNRILKPKERKAVFTMLNTKHNVY